MIPNNYEGLIQSLNLRRIENYQEPKEYPANFGGLVEAILDLNWGQANTGTRPPNWNQSTLSYSVSPSEGALWFDTRQGRLMVFAHGDWYQTNGGDGYPVVDPTPPTDPVTGQLWFDFTNSALNIWNGINWVPITSSETVTKSALRDALNASTDFATFKTNMLALL